MIAATIVAMVVVIFGTIAGTAIVAACLMIGGDDDADT